jgi:hypothetical protein
VSSTSRRSWSASVLSSTTRPCTALIRPKQRRSSSRWQKRQLSPKRKTPTYPLALFTLFATLTMTHFRVMQMESDLSDEFRAILYWHRALVAPEAAAAELRCIRERPFAAGP